MRGATDGDVREPAPLRDLVRPISARLAAFHENDADTALAVAFDAALLSCASNRIEYSCRYKVERDGCLDAPTIRLAIAYKLDVRLDRLLSSGLGVSREQLRSRLADGTLTIVTDSSQALRRSARDGQLITCFAEHGPSFAHR